MDSTSIVYITAEVITGVLSIVGNLIVLAAILRTPRLHTVTNVFISNLAIADIVVGFLVAPCAALASIGVDMTFYGCVLMNSLILMFTNVSILMLLGVAFERFFAIKEPFVYQRVLTVRRAIYANLLIWVLGLLLGLVPMYGWNAGYYSYGPCYFTNVITMEYMVYFQFFGLVLAPLFLMLCVYIYILSIVRKHQRQTHTMQTMFRGQPGQQAPKDNFNKDVRAAKLFALVILLFGIFWLPVNIFNCFTLFCPTCIFPFEALLAAIVMSHANSSINPFIYAASNSRIKNAILDLFGIKPSGDTEDRAGLKNGWQSSASNEPSHRPTTNHNSQSQQAQPHAHGGTSGNGGESGGVFTVSKEIHLNGTANNAVSENSTAVNGQLESGLGVSYTAVQDIQNTTFGGGLSGGTPSHDRDDTGLPADGDSKLPAKSPSDIGSDVSGHVNPAFTLGETNPVGNEDVNSNSQKDSLGGVIEAIEKLDGLEDVVESKDSNNVEVIVEGRAGRRRKTYSVDSSDTEEHVAINTTTHLTKL